MAVYTKTGDHGTTSLISGERVQKFDPRVEAYGSVDELQAVVAVLHDLVAKHLGDDTVTRQIETVLGELMTVESMFAEGNTTKYIKPLSEDSVARLEGEIDAMSAELPKITKFTIPGGHICCSVCHVARTVCRRAERRAVQTATEYDLPQTGLSYLNRLADWLYTLGRVLSLRLDVKEILWLP